MNLFKRLGHFSFRDTAGTQTWCYINRGRITAVLSCSCFFSPSGVYWVHLELAVNFVQEQRNWNSSHWLISRDVSLVNESIHTLNEKKNLFVERLSKCFYGNLSSTLELFIDMTSFILTKKKAFILVRVHLNRLHLLIESGTSLTLDVFMLRYNTIILVYHLFY